MRDQVTNLGGVFGKKMPHPLADAQEVRRIITELPKDNVFKAIDGIIGWLESAKAAEHLGADRLYGAVSQLEDAGREHLRRLCRDYLHTSRLSRTEETRLWSISHGYWSLLAILYERCLRGLAPGGKMTEASLAVLPALCVRLIAALGAILKWERFRCSPPANAIWQRLGQALLAAEAAGVAMRPVVLGQGERASSPAQEYQKVMIFHAASMDSLAPLEIELAERLIEHFLSGFVFAAEARHDCVYWVDLQLAQPPLRLAQMPREAKPSLRFYRPGPAHAQLCELLHSIERGGELPADIDLGGQYPGRTLLPVLRHLVAYLAPVPPQRQHDRHRVRHQVTVLNGLVNAFVVFSGEFGDRPAGLHMENWAVDNVSRGGFGAVVGNSPDWLRVGALLTIQPEGGDNWLLGIVRRYYREGEGKAQVGIETLARNVLAVELKARASSSYAVVGGTPGLLLENRGEPGEVRVVLPPASFDLKEALVCVIDGRRCQLSPMALVEHTTDYELARYYLSQPG
ncbi:MAG: hypothetical protein FWF20_00040 [Betaproteobacteria bacterium]|nr:hypothetical protein [Betaproteobacteria bacterium]MCL2885170.1 hypothetical protein [Betaproteobacteria bacterium]